jgi:LmbE family N-acetylglucosaminyl deacetylase
MQRWLLIALIVIVFVNASQGRAQDKKSVALYGSSSSHVLLVVAHPDDESEMAGTIYRITKELSGVVDQVIISDGEGGFRYASLAGRYYGADLANEPVGRALLPHIRQIETRRAGRVLGIRHQWFLNERDDHYTLNVQEVLEKSWHADRVEKWLVQRISNGRYDEVFVLLPTEDAHGEHKAASILALRAVEELPESQRPAVLGVQASPNNAASYETLSGYPITAANSSQPQFHFDRDVRFGFRNSLTYQIVVNWVISEHKSQGLFQTTVGQNRFENFWVFSSGGGSTSRNPTALFEKITPSPQTTGLARSVANAK